MIVYIDKTTSICNIIMFSDHATYLGLYRLILD